MQLMQSKTKITSWTVSDGKESIAFDRFDFSPRQVGVLERMIRLADETISLRIEPLQKQVKIEPIECHGRVGDMDCRKGGQKITLAEFTSPDPRGEAMKRLVKSATAVLVTISETQGQNRLFKEPDDLDETDTADPDTDNGLEKIEKTITFGRGRRERVEVSVVRNAASQVHASADCRTGKESLSVLEHAWDGVDWSATAVAACATLLDAVMAWFEKHLSEPALAVVRPKLTDDLTAFAAALDAEWQAERDDEETT